MFEEPEYFEELSYSISESTAKLLLVLEKQLHTLSYEDHFDKISLVTQNNSELGTGDISESSVEIYRSTIDDVLQRQGISLMNPLSDPLYKLVTLMEGVTLLATSTLEDLLIETSSDEDDNLVYLSSILAEITDLSIDDGLSLIESVNPMTIDVIKIDGELEAVFDKDADIARLRYLVNTPAAKREGLVADIVRAVGHYGLNLRNTFTLISADIDNLPTLAEQAFELKSLILVSNIPSSLMQLETEEYAELMIPNLKDMMTLLSMIRYAEPEND